MSPDLSVARDSGTQARMDPRNREIEWDHAEGLEEVFDVDLAALRCHEQGRVDHSSHGERGRRDAAHGSAVLGH